MIKPTVGRVVWFMPSSMDLICNPPRTKDVPSDPFAAIVCYVWSDRCVNLVVFDHNGCGHPRSSVNLIQDDDAKSDKDAYCEWMPYQVGQAKKHAAEDAAS